jgi:hypothetical protein
MSTVQLTQVSAAVQVIVNLDKARNALVNGVSKIGEVIQGYADGLSQTFDLVDANGAVTTKWYDLQGVLNKPVKAERAVFVKLMQDKGYEADTINTYWARVKKAAGHVTAGNKVSGGAQDTDAKTFAELKTMLNRIFNDDTDCKAQQIKGILIDAYVQMGGDAMKLGTTNK